MIRVFLAGLGFVAFSCVGQMAMALAQGAEVKVTSLEFLTKGAQYQDLGQPEDEPKTANDDLILISYTMSQNNKTESRRLWDKDGLATLFFYHRNLTTQVATQKMQLNQQLPSPKTAPLKAFDLLMNVYKSKKTSEDNHKADEIAKAKKEFENATTLADLKATSFETLLNGLINKHSYEIEVGEDQILHNESLDESFIRQAPPSLGAKMASRQMDRPVINWRTATSSFYSSPATQSGGAKTGM